MNALTDIAAPIRGVSAEPSMVSVAESFSRNRTFYRELPEGTLAMCMSNEIGGLDIIRRPEDRPKPMKRPNWLLALWRS